MTDWIYRAHLIVPIAYVVQADQYAAAADPDSGGDKTFSEGIPLSPTGNPPATHRAASTLCRDSGRQAIIAAWPQIPGGAVYWGDQWSWEEAITDAGLKLVEDI